MVNIAFITIIGLLFVISFSLYAGLMREIAEEDLPEFERPGVLSKCLGPHLLDAILYILSGRYKHATEDRRILKDFALLRVLFATQIMLVALLMAYNVFAT